MTDFCKTISDQEVEELYYQASRKPEHFVTDGGVPVDERWWDAIEQAYRQGFDDAVSGLHDAAARGGLPAVSLDDQKRRDIELVIWRHAIKCAANEADSAQGIITGRIDVQHSVIALRILALLDCDPPRSDWMGT